MSSVNPFPDHVGAHPEAAILVVSPGLVVLSATPAAERLLAAPSGGLVGVAMRTLVPLERRPELHNFEAVLAGGGGRRLRSALWAAGGRQVDVSLTLAPCMDELGRVTSVSARYEPARLSAHWVRASMTPPRLSDSADAPRGAPVPERPSVDLPQDSQSRLTITNLATGLQAQLGELDGCLHWLEEFLAQSSKRALFESARERARVMSVLGEARELTARCWHALVTDGVPESTVPLPPKMPRL